MMSEEDQGAIIHSGSEKAICMYGKVSPIKVLTISRRVKQALQLMRLGRPDRLDRPLGLVSHRKRSMTIFGRSAAGGVRARRCDRLVAEGCPGAKVGEGRAAGRHPTRPYHGEALAV